MRSIKILLVGLFLCAVFTGFGKDKDDNKCRHKVIDKKEFQTISQWIENDLLNGVWTYDHQDGEHIIFFKEYGVADIVAHGTEGNHFSYNNLWRIEEFGGMGFLVLTAQDDGHEKLYKIEQTCEGITLTDVSNENVIDLVYASKPNVEGKQMLETQIVGNWVNTSYSYKSDNNLKVLSALVKMQFAENGTYEMVFDGVEGTFTEEGIWEVAEDGLHILLHISYKGSSEDISSSRVIQVDQIIDDQMALRQMIDHGPSKYHTAWKEFSMAKSHVN